MNPFLYRSKTIAWCKAQGIQIQSYRSLRDGKAFADPTVCRVAAKHAKTSAQVLGRWCVSACVSACASVRARLTIHAKRLSGIHA